MQSVLFIVAAVTLALYIAVGLQVTFGSRRLSYLHRIHPLAAADCPRVSIVIPACNEERHIETALSSVLLQDYPDFEVIAVDDRSTDSTGLILDRMATRNPLLRVVHIKTLPTCWLGKNHALQSGASLATGGILLFTDADVVMDRTAVSRAVAYMVRENVDHLAVSPKATVPGFLPNAFIAAFVLLFTMYTKPWKVRDPRAREHVGIGAFNMVRTSVYWNAGGHQPIAMRPDDDVKLGKLLKSRGAVQDFLFGAGSLSVEWYPSFGAMRAGLMKNLFAGIEYSVPSVVFFSLLQVLLLIWPFLALFETTGAIFVLNAAIVASLFLAFALNAPRVGVRAVWCFAMPVGAVISIYLMMRSMVLTLKQQGIEWRGTLYPLDQLRANRV